MKKERQRSLLSRLMRSYVELGQYNKAMLAAARPPREGDELEECSQKLEFRIVSGEIPRGNFSNLEQEKIYFRAVFQQFLQSLHLSSEPWSPGWQLDVYSGLLKVHPSHVGSLIAKGILESDILDHPLEWDRWGLIPPNTKEEEWKTSLTRDAIAMLEKAYRLSPSITVRRNVEGCIQELKDVLN